MFRTNPNLTVTAKVASNHSKILAEDFHAVAEAVGPRRRRARLNRDHHQPRIGRNSRPSSGARERA